MSLHRLNTSPSRVDRDGASLLSPIGYDDDAASIHSRSDQDTDSDDDQLQQRARNSRELRAHDRIVLMEEEELENLVTDTRRRQDRERRGSGLNVPNALNLFRRPSLTSMSSAGSSVENLVSEKRQERRSRRTQRRQRLKEDAQHGEDGELMYEMEEGGMKDGSSTGSSSDRDDSDEVDRRQLNMVASAKAQRGRHWWRWMFIYTLIIIGFAMLVLIAWKLSKNRKSAIRHRYVSNGTALFAPTTIIISLDGFRADFLQRGLTPRLDAFVKEGVSPKYMTPSFPSVTFPNHYTLATGLYPESHGIVGNTFWDPELQQEFYYTDPGRSLDPKWWKGEPFWVTAETQSVRSAIHMWPGSEAHILNTEPSFMDEFNSKEKLPNKVSRIMEFLDKPGKEDKTADVKSMRPQLIAAYVPDVDADGHRFGPNSTEIRSTIQSVDAMMDQIFKGLESRNLTHIVNVIVVSDHGMATTDTQRLLQLEDLVDTSKVERTDGWPLYGLRPKNPDDLQGLYDGLAEKSKSNPNFEVYLRDVNMPERYHFSKNERIAPLWIVPKTGWAIVTKKEMDVNKAKKTGEVYRPKGMHGYDHEHPLMRAIFIARGPAFPHPANSQIDVFQNIEVYNILCDSVGMAPKPNNGTLRLPLKPIGMHKIEEPLEQPEDPVPANEVASSKQPEQPARPTQPAAPETPVKPDLPTAPATPSNPPERPTTPEKPSSPPERPELPAKPTDPATGGGKHGDDDGDDGDASKSPEDKVKEKFIGVWDWITGHANKIWDKITGSD